MSDIIVTDNLNNGSPGECTLGLENVVENQMHIDNKMQTQGGVHTTIFSKEMVVTASDCKVGDRPDGIATIPVKDTQVATVIISPVLYHCAKFLFGCGWESSRPL